MVAHRDRLGERAAKREHEVVEPREHSRSWLARRRVPEVRDDGLHELCEDLRGAAPSEVQRAGREVLHAARRLDGEGEVSLVRFVDSYVVVRIRQVDRPHEIALVQRPAQRRQAAEAADPLDAEVVQVLEVEDEALLAVVLDDEGLRNVVEGLRAHECAGLKAPVALCRHPSTVFGPCARDAVVEGRRRLIDPIDPHALADPAEDVARRADLGPECCGRAHALLQRRQPWRPRRRWRRRRRRRRRDAVRGLGGRELWCRRR